MRAYSGNRRRFWLAGVALGLVVLTCLVWAGGWGESRAKAELDDRQWQRLTRQLTRVADQENLRLKVPERRPGLPPCGVLPRAISRPLRPGPDAPTLALQAAEYLRNENRNILGLQQFRRIDSGPIADGQGREGVARLINLNPRVNFWYVLELDWDGAEAPLRYHLSNSRPQGAELALAADFPGGIVLETASDRRPCDLWSTDSPGSLAAASRLSAPYVTLCDEAVALQLPTAGRRTRLEWTTDFLRDHVWVGEALTVLVRDNLYSDSHLVKGELIAGNPAKKGPFEVIRAPVGVPSAASIEPGRADDLLVPVDLGLRLEPQQSLLRVGAWSPAAGNPGIFVSVLRPGLVTSEILEAPPLGGGKLDAVEAEALTYLVAFDLDRFEMGFAVGTDHPRVGWSERVRPEMRDDSLPGPDGIGSIAPLVAGGLVPHALAERTVATFTAGFKRSHGAFRSGDLGRVHFGSHYGFIENGVVLSKLQPGLATVFGLDDGSLQMKTWSAADDKLLERVVYARQNGVPLVENWKPGGPGVPGSLVIRWSDGNWSGSEDRRLRTVRAGICLQQSAAGRFLIYGYFSSATPIAMARVFQAYGCSYAMLTDMNALEHTYLALYRSEASRLTVDHLITGMAVLDQEVEGGTLPRFLGFADNRDFFYMTRRPPAEVAETALRAP